MSSHAEMDRRDSEQSLSSRRGSETGSRYQVESGLYVTSFAATIFIAALVTVGVLLITLLVSLTVMLQSCQSKSAGVIEVDKMNEESDYCKVLAFHAELNRLGADEFPTVCKAYAIQYIKGHYRELQLTKQLIESYLNTLVPNDDGKDAVLLDIDAIFAEKSLHHDYLLHYRDNLTEAAKQPPDAFLLSLFRALRNQGWSMTLFTRQHENQQNATIDILISAGYGGWSALIMRSDDELRMEAWEYLSRRRVELHDQGFRIISIISNHMDALVGPFLGKQNFKLPSTFYYQIAKHVVM